jgi:Xaa-Pro aminopeptidase
VKKRVDPWSFIKKSEYIERQNRARQAAQKAGLDGLVFFSKGGAAVDMLANVLYLTNHYTQQPYVMDYHNIWSAGSHGAVVLPVNGPTILIVDNAYWRPDLVVADDVRAGVRVVELTAGAILDTGLVGKKVGLVGTGAMTAAAYIRFIKEVESTSVEIKDGILDEIMVIKSPAEQALIRQSCDIGSRAVEAMLDAAVVGATEAEAASAAYSVAVSEGAVVWDAACNSGDKSHLFSWARIPSHDGFRPMQKGEYFHVDCYGMFGGYAWDFGRTRVIGDQPTDEQRAYLEATIEGVETICNNIKPGITAGNIGEIYMDWVEGKNAIRDFLALSEGEEEEEGFPAVGHGLGIGWSSPWLMKGDETIIKPGMYLAVELLFGHESRGGFFYEENGLVKEDGFEILTKSKKRYW